MRFSMTAMLAIFFVLLASGCVQEKPINSLVVGKVEYSFANDVRDALKVPVTSRTDIQALLLQASSIDLIFQCSAQDNPYIAAAGYNVVNTIQNYFVYEEGRYAAFNTYCFRGSQWYNSQDDEIEKPILGTTIWLKGPTTGANETSVTLENTTITAQGKSYRELSLAADALSLAFLGVNRV